MKRLTLNKLALSFVGLLATFQAHAEPYTFKFDKVPAATVLHATYKTLFGVNYVLDASVTTNKNLVTLDVAGVDEQQLKSTVDTALMTAGIYKHQSPDGITFFTGSAKPLWTSSAADSYPAFDMPELPSASLSSDAVKDVVQQIDVFLPKNRDSEYLQPIINQLLGTSYTAKSDSVFISGDVEQVERARYILEQLDQPVSEVLAKALIVEFSESSTAGNTFEFAISALSGKLKIGLGSLIPAGENFVKFSDTDLTAVLSAVSGDSRFNVVSSPTLRVRDGHTARVTVGQDVPTLSSTTLDNNGNAQTAIEYRSAGVIFELKPSILKTRVELNLKAEISDFAQTSSSGIDSPTLTKRQLSTAVAARPGELIVLGGLHQDKDQDVERGFSFLPRFMRSKSRAGDKTQVLVFLQVQRVI